MTDFATRARASTIRVAAALVLAATACSIRSITIPASADAFAPVADLATIIIVQPTTDVRLVHILDGNGQLVGQLYYQSKTVVRVPPGPVRLYAVSDNEPSTGDRITGSVLAGKTYYATISVRWAGLKFLALKPSSRDERWKSREQYLTRPALVMDAAHVPEATAALGDPAEIIASADRFADGLEGAHREERTIAPEDGL